MDGDARLEEDPAGKSTGSVQSQLWGVSRRVLDPVKSVISRCQEKPLSSLYRNRTSNRHR
jgi:hypothetical protein